MVRAGDDQTLPIDPCRMQSVCQGLDPRAGGDYNSLLWRMGLLTRTNSPR
jgi:endo-1,4-beta-xylanase